MKELTAAAKGPLSAELSEGLGRLRRQIDADESEGLAPWRQQMDTDESESS